MKREIKFRARNKEKNEWLYLPETGDIELTQYIGNSFEFSYDEESVDIQQYTGIKDKEGKEIYEGDILEGHSDGNVKVVFQDACWQCIFSDGGNIGLDEMCIWFGNKAIVIGNIYEHPSLLNEQSQ